MNVEGIHTARHARPLPGSAQFDKANPWCFVGTRSGVMRARSRRGSLVAPVDADPFSWKWPVDGLSVFVVNDGADEEVGFNVASAMINHGALMVTIVNRKGDDVVSHRYLYGSKHESLSQLEGQHEPLF